MVTYDNKMITHWCIFNENTKSHLLSQIVCSHYDENHKLLFSLAFSCIKKGTISCKKKRKKRKKNLVGG